MDRPEIVIHWWGIIAAAFAYMVLGAFWFSERAFGKTWRAEGNMETSSAEMSKRLLLSFVGAIFIAFVMTHFISYSAYYMGVGGLIGGIQTAFWAWLGFAAAPYLITVLFENRSFTLYLVNAGFHLAGLVLTGIILGLWM